MVMMFAERVPSRLKGVDDVLAALDALGVASLRFQLDASNDDGWVVPGGGRDAPWVSVLPGHPVLDESALLKSLEAVGYRDGVQRLQAAVCRHLDDVQGGWECGDGTEGTVEVAVPSGRPTPDTHPRQSWCP